MNARSTPDPSARGPVRSTLARLIEPAVPGQRYRAARGAEAEASADVAPVTEAEPERPRPSPEDGKAVAQGRPPVALPGTGQPAGGPGGAAADGADRSDGSDPLDGAPGDGPDPLAAADPALAADAAAGENLLRCWVRENDVPAPAGGVLRLPLETLRTDLLVPVRYWSPTGWHRFGPPRLAAAPPHSPPLDAVALAALVGREAAHRAARPPHTPRPSAPPAAPGTPATAPAPPAGHATAPAPPAGHATALVGRVADSVHRTAAFLAARRAETRPAAPGPARPAPRGDAPHGPFLQAEQALLFGHPLHPTPKSREGLSEAEALAYAPETRAAFPLHWMAVDRGLLAHDSAWTERGRPVPAEALARRLAGDAVTARLPAGTAPLPLHPWQARDVPHRPALARLLDDGLLHDLGPGGDPWYPTSSLRTVMRPGGPAMLKLSLGLRITNSRRENLRKEALRGVEVHRLLRTGLAAAWQAAHPGFDIVRDPAWLGVDAPPGAPLPGLDTVIRHNPFAPADDAACLAGLTAPLPVASPDASPDGGPHGGRLRSRLAELVDRIAARTARPPRAVATEWFLRYLHAVVRPVLWLDAHAGIALEAHQQNTVVLLDADGWPAGGRYRDNQGYYFRASHRAALQARLPGSALGEASDTFVADAVVDERFAYYLGINNVFGLVGALGSQRLADEEVLLAALRRFLCHEARPAGDAAPVSPLPALLLESPALRCKANLLTRLHGLDELVGPVDTQSVYVTLTNPLAR